MNYELRLARTFRDVMSEWSLWDDGKTAHIEAKVTNDTIFVGYIDHFQGVPFTAHSLLAKEPPTVVNLNWSDRDRILWLVSIQLHPKYRGQGHGAALYERVIESECRREGRWRTGRR